MKQLITLIFSTFLFAYSTHSTAQCAGNITLLTQAEVNTFVSDYGCSVIEGDLTIGEWVDDESDINDLTALENITTVGGDLRISNTNISSLDGLQNITIVEGGLSINNNDVLTNIDVLQNLSSIGGNLLIANNEALTNIDGLQNISSIGGSLRVIGNNSLFNLDGLQNINSIVSLLWIKNNESLTNLDGLQNINSIVSYLLIENNESLTNIDGLQNITAVEGNLEIIDNEALTNLDGLQSITNVNGELEITNNANLLNIDGLYNISAVEEALYINNNEVLTNLDGFQNITIVNGELFITNNANLLNIDGLYNITAVEGNLRINNNESLTNIDGLYNITAVEGNLSVIGNDSLTNLDGLQNLNYIEGIFLQISGNNLLTNLDGLENISLIEGTLFIYDNNSLTNLDGLENISLIEGALEITNNEALTSLDGLQNLNYIGGGVQISTNNALNNLNGLGNLTTIGLGLILSSNGNITDLDGLQNLNSIGDYLSVSSNDALSNLNGLQNITNIGGNISIKNNSILETCCSILPALTTFEGNIVINNNLPSCNSIEAIFGFCYGNSVQAQAFFDENENGVYDATEQIFQQSFNLDPSAILSFSDNTGVAYFALAGFGEYELSLDNTNPLWELGGENNPIQINYQDSTFSDTLYHFPMIPSGEVIVQSVDLSSSITRCNQNTNYWLTYTNKGNTINEGYVELIPDELTNFVSADPPADSTAGNTLYWFYENLYPTHSNQIHLVYDMPSVDEIGAQITFEANIETNEGFGDNKAILSSELVCAYDPNDKLVTPAGVGGENYTLFGDTLEYTIRFQNTGNDTAFTVIIEDELSEYLDLSTFRPIASSHNVSTQVDIDTRIATFTFNDIYLPDSFVNEVASHGFVKFQIQGNESLESFTAIENTASIFFDANPAIVTNTVLNTFSESIPSVFMGKVFLEGCYAGDQTMTTDIKEWMPTEQPFNTAPYYYEGTESLNGVPYNAVDWVLVEARVGTPNLSGEAGTNVVEQIAGIILSDGNIINTNGTTGLRFVNLEEGQEYYFSIRHRNHLDVLTANPVTAQLEMNYDFSLSPEMAFGTEQQKLSADGTPVLFSGDANGDGLILNTDYDLWFLNNAVLNTYSPTDLNLDGVIQVTDYDLWFLNKAKVGIVELQE